MQPMVQSIRSTIDAVWCLFDTDGSGSVDREEFLRPGEGAPNCHMLWSKCGERGSETLVCAGLADTILAQVQLG